MGEVRYGARPVVAQSNREVEATRNAIWSKAVTIVFRTDPEAIAAVLPRPLGPAAPTARLRIAVVDMGTGLPTFGAGWFGVRARHGDVEGEYALFMPMSTEQATTGGRETFGEPKKIARLHLDVDGDSLTAGVARMGSQVAEVSGTLGPEGPGYEIDKLDFYFKGLPDPSGEGLDGDPALVYATRRPVSSDRSPASASSSRHPWTRSPTSRSKRCCRSSTPRSRRPSPARSWSSCRRSG